VSGLLPCFAARSKQPALCPGVFRLRPAEIGEQELLPQKPLCAFLAQTDGPCLIGTGGLEQQFGIPLAVVKQDFGRGNERLGRSGAVALRFTARIQRRFQRERVRSSF